MSFLKITPCVYNFLCSSSLQTYTRPTKHTSPKSDVLNFVILFYPGYLWLFLKAQNNWAWFGLVWFGLVWFGLVWFGLVWFGLVWFCWFGLIWFG